MGTKKPRYAYITVLRSLQDTANLNGTSKLSTNLLQKQLSAEAC